MDRKESIFSSIFCVNKTVLEIANKKILAYNVVVLPEAVEVMMGYYVMVFS